MVIIISNMADAKHCVHDIQLKITPVPQVYVAHSQLQRDRNEIQKYRHDKNLDICGPH